MDERMDERMDETDFIDPSIFNQGLINEKLIIANTKWPPGPKKMVLAIFTRCLVPELCILCHFAVKSAFLGLNSSRTKEITAKPMVLSYIGHFSKHCKKKSLEQFFLKVRKT